MAGRQENKTITIGPDRGEPDPDIVVGQRKKPDSGQFRLQVDRQTKASYMTLEAAEAAGLVIKKAHPIVQVTVHDATTGVNKIIELQNR